MKKVPNISLALIIGVASCNFGSGTLAQSDAQISTIRTQYAAINKRAARYKKVKKLLSGFSLEGGDLVAHFDGPAIVKLVATHYGEMGRSTEEYYYSNGKLIFVYERALHYNKPMGKVVRSTESRYYFDNDQLIRWLDENGKHADTTSEIARSTQKNLLENSTLFLAGARSKNREIVAEQ
jgi:hypothetical protein